MIITIPGVEAPYSGQQLKASNEAFLKTATGANKFHHISAGSIAYPEYPKNTHDKENALAARNAPVSKFLLAAHDAFALHVPFVISPETLWYVVVHELAVVVKSDSEKYRYIFSQLPGKQLITVRDDALVYGVSQVWCSVIPRFVEFLHEAMNPEIVPIFIPQFSTISSIDTASLCVAFMDVVSQYYEFRLVTLCGIPEIRLNGTALDWALFVKNLEGLRELFPELQAYFSDLLPVVKKICDSFGESGPDIEFWSNMYKLNDHSGGPDVTGWLNAFLAYSHHWKDGYSMKQEFNWQNFHCTTDQFPAHFSSVPFIWEYLDKKIPMRFGAGIIEVEWDENALHPKLGFLVAE